MENINLMITSELCDSNNKMLKISPVEVDFKEVEGGAERERFIHIRNDDDVTSRVQVERTINLSCFRVEEFIGGKISPGEFKRIKIVLKADKSLTGQQLKEVLLIRTKTFIYKIPLKVKILTDAEFYQKKNEMEKEMERKREMIELEQREAREERRKTRFEEEDSKINKELRKIEHRFREKLISEVEFKRQRDELEQERKEAKEKAEQELEKMEEQRRRAKFEREDKKREEKIERAERKRREIEEIKRKGAKPRNENEESKKRGHEMNTDAEFGAGRSTSHLPPLFLQIKEKYKNVLNQPVMEEGSESIN